MFAKSDQVKSILLVAGLSAVAFVLAMKLMGAVSGAIFLWAFLVALPLVVYWRARHLRRLTQGDMNGSLKNLRTRSPRTLLNWLRQNIIGHRDCVRAILEQIEQNMALAKRGRHLGAYLLMGPTGTGKTFFAHLLAEGLFGQERILVIPMSQYSSPGADAGTVLSQVLEKYWKTPECLILFDEIDRAAEHVQDALLHLLDCGEIIDPKSSERFLLPYVLMIATTNLGLNYLRTEPELTEPPAQNELRDALVKSGFDKPMVARFDGVYLFRELPKLDIVTIALMQLRHYYRDHQIAVQYVAPEVLVKIVQENAAYREYGVRQLQRLVRNMSDEPVLEAKRRGAVSVTLEFDPATKTTRVRDERRKAA